MPELPNELPLPTQPTPNNDEAADLVRQKVHQAYTAEPSALAEEKEIKAVGPTSKHQQFIADLMKSGKSLSEIQAAWHQYYGALTDHEKHEVWQEFYANQALSVTKPKAKVMPQHPGQPTQKVFEDEPTAKPQTKASDIKNKIVKTATGGGKLKVRHHLQSLIFGLGVGAFIIFIFMFTFFNERFIAPFISPSKAAINTPVIIEPTDSNIVTQDNKIVIPKINVEVPVVYDAPSISEADMQAALNKGVVHYPQSPVPGQNGNVVVVGHSANNIFNSGKYKFAFALLNRLQEGDIFMMTYGGQRYIYKIYSRQIVKPTDVAVLGPADKAATATLITCDPPGTNLNRLVLIGEQISPSPDKNIASLTPSTPAAQPAVLPGNSETLFHRLFGWIYD